MMVVVERKLVGDDDGDRFNLMQKLHPQPLSSYSTIVPMTPVPHGHGPTTLLLPILDCSDSCSYSIVALHPVHLLPYPYPPSHYCYDADPTIPDHLPSSYSSIGSPTTMTYTVTMTIGPWRNYVVNDWLSFSYAS